jgi:hypothetical protein
MEGGRGWASDSAPIQANVTKASIGHNDERQCAQPYPSDAAVCVRGDRRC